MKLYIGMAIVAASLAGCGSTDSGSSVYLNNGADTSFLQQGTTSCPGVIQSGNPIYERYPLRCGPQAQVIPY